MSSPTSYEPAPSSFAHALEGHFMIRTRVARMMNRGQRGSASPASPPPRRVAGEDDPTFERFYVQSKPYTMRSRERALASYDAASYIVKHDIPGAFVECGTWRGGSAMMLALVLLENQSRRDLYLFDTFKGMTLPGSLDVDHLDRPAIDRWTAEQTADRNDWCYADRADVERNVLQTGFWADSLHLIEGDVEETVPDGAPDQIAFLHLDTDWY